MTVPDVEPITTRIYDALPEAYRHADTHQGTGDNQAPLLRYLAGLFDDAQPAEDLPELMYILGLDTPGSNVGSGDPLADLLDFILTGDTRVQAWLPYLASWAGVILDRSDSLVDQADAVTAPDRFLAGTLGGP